MNLAEATARVRLMAGTQTIWELTDDDKRALRAVVDALGALRDLHDEAHDVAHGIDGDLSDLRHAVERTDAKLRAAGDGR